MRKVLASVLMAGLAGPTFAEAPALDFDGAAVNVGDVLAHAKTAAKEASEEEDGDVKGMKVKYRAERDCVRFVFNPGGGTVSEPVWLRSTEYREECDYYRDRDGRTRRYCREVPRWTYRERVQVEVTEREDLFPWEKEAFGVCLEGAWLSIYEIQAAHKYKARRTGGYFTLTAGERKPMDPDSSGLSATAPGNTGTGLDIVFRDRWAKYYEGEQVVIKFKLRKQVDGWFDSTLLEGEASFAVSNEYVVDFAKYEPDLKAGKKYYVEWGFKRVGEISTDEYVKKGDTGTTVYKPSLRVAFR